MTLPQLGVLHPRSADRLTLTLNFGSSAPTRASITYRWQGDIVSDYAKLRT